jgi:hypothetical protein
VTYRLIAPVALSSSWSWISFNLRLNLDTNLTTQNNLLLPEIAAIA